VRKRREEERKRGRLRLKVLKIAAIKHLPTWVIQRKRDPRRKA